LKPLILKRTISLVRTQVGQGHNVHTLRAETVNVDFKIQSLKSDKIVEKLRAVRLHQIKKQNFGMSVLAKHGDRSLFFNFDGIASLNPISV